jgi:hypothetical protein
MTWDNGMMKHWNDGFYLGKQFSLKNPSLITQYSTVAEQLIKEFIEKYGMGRDWSEFV